MTDQSMHAPLSRPHRPPRAEYAIYFAILLVLALPIAAAGFALALMRGDRRRIAGGVLRQALSEARTVTPRIFSA